MPISDSSVNKYIITRLQAAHCHIEVHTKISINKLVYKMKSANVQTMRVKIRMRIKDPSLIIYNIFVWCFFFFFNRQHLQLFVMMSTSDQSITDLKQFKTVNPVLNFDKCLKLTCIGFMTTYSAQHI